MWLAVAAITLLAAIAFIALAFAVQFERQSVMLISRAAVPSPCHQSPLELAYGSDLCSVPDANLGAMSFSSISFWIV
jgi:hypothetical protein